MSDPARVPNLPKPPDPSELFGKFRASILFKDCPDDFIYWLVAQAKPVFAPKGTAILTAGSPNDRLGLLVSGELSVTVNGEQVAIVNTPGDIIGEISVLTSNVSSATVMAATDVEFLEVRPHELEKKDPVKTHEFGFYLYRSLACSLSAKIVQTNKKAMQYEVTNRTLSDFSQKLDEANQALETRVRERTIDLERKSDELTLANAEMEARNTEILASHRKLEELYLTKDITFKKLDHLEADCLTPLNETLHRLSLIARDEERKLVAAAQERLTASIEMLKPFGQLHLSETAMRSQKVLLIEDDRKQHVIAKLALSGSGVQLDLAGNTAEVYDHINSGKRYDLIFLSSHLAEILPELYENMPLARIVLMSACDMPGELPILRKFSYYISNIVSRHPEDRAFTVKNIATTASKLVAKDIFGMEKYLIWGVETQSRAVKSSRDRRELVGEMRDHFSKLGVRDTLSDTMAAVAEELLMNAIYDAPVSATRASLYNHLQRTIAVDLKPSEQAEFRFACDGILAAISVSDPFGGFEMKTLFNYLERNFLPDQDNSQEPGKGGGGLGLHQIVVNSDLVVFNVRRNVRTEVIALFNLDNKVTRKDLKPTFHFFYQT